VSAAYPMIMPMPRCLWAGSDPLYIQYHDSEWGIPVHDDGKLFEMLVLESFQAGLSWLTILRKRENFRNAFAGFDPELVARFDDRDRERLLNDVGIVRNRAKIDAAIGNAACFLKIQDAFGSFASYAWAFVDNTPIVALPRPRTLADFRPRSGESDVMAADMKRRGFRFFGTTICYAHMQACGMVDDHMEGCFRAIG